MDNSFNQLHLHIDVSPPNQLQTLTKKKKQKRFKLSI